MDDGTADGCRRVGTSVRIGTTVLRRLTSQTSVRLKVCKDDDRRDCTDDRVSGAMNDRVDDRADDSVADRMADRSVDRTADGASDHADYCSNFHADEPDDHRPPCR